MGIFLVGLSHRTAPVELREQIAFSREGVSAALMLFKSQFPNSEAAILSTCNRVEIIASGEAPELSLAHLIRFIAQARSVPEKNFEQHLYQHRGKNALRHLFRVIGGLDSMVLGETQIVNQLKQAYQLAHEQGTAGSTLHRLFHHAFGVSKRLRSETAISTGKLSLPSVAADVIARDLPAFAQKRIVILGAGEMAQLSVQYMKKAGATDLVILSRNTANGKAVADACGGRSTSFHQLDVELAQADVVIAATSCPQPLLYESRIRVAQAGRPARSLLLIDLAVPRNIAPDVRAVANVTLHDVDSLGGTAAQNHVERKAQVRACNEIVEEEVREFQKWLAASRVGPLIERMCTDVRALADVEVRSLFRSCPDLTEDQREQVSDMIGRLVNKLMHPCISTVRDQSLSAFDTEPACDRSCPHAPFATSLPLVEMKV